MNSIKTSRMNGNEKVDAKFKLLRAFRNKRSQLKLEINHQLTAELIKFITHLSRYFEVYIGIGELKGIRKKATKRQSKKSHRKRMHKWAFSQLTELLRYKLLKINSQIRFANVSEAYTSITCWKCAHRGNRPQQNYFVCRHTLCGWRGHADLNGSTNIAKRTASYFKLATNLKPFLLTNGRSGLSPVNTRLKRRVINSPGNKIRRNLEQVSPNAGVYDPSVIKVTEKLSSMSLSDFEFHDNGEAEGSTGPLGNPTGSKPHSVPALIRVKKSEWQHFERGSRT